MGNLMGPTNAPLFVSLAQNFFSFESSIVASIGGATVVPEVRTVPATADRYYVLTRQPDGSAKVFRMERNLGGGGGSDLGSKWYEFRKTAEGLLPIFVTGNPATQTVWVSDESGAFDFVARDASNVNYGSYHGLGAGGSMPSETLKMDGVVVSHLVASSGNSFEVRNTTVATNGVNTVTRDLSTIFTAGQCKYRLNSVSHTGLVLFYYGMPIATGQNYSELWAKVGTAWTILDMAMLSDGGLAFLEGTKAVRMRDPTTGLYTEASGELPSLANFVRCRTDKQPFANRTKTYLSQFSDVTALAGAEIIFDVGTSAVGAGALPANLLTDPNWVTNWVTVQTGGTVVAAGTDLTMTWASGTTNLRRGAPINGCVSGQQYFAVVDLITEGATGVKRAYGAPAASLSTTGTAFMLVNNVSPQLLLGRSIILFTANQNAPLQHFAVSGSLTGAGSVVFRNPAVYPAAA